MLNIIFPQTKFLLLPNPTPFSSLNICCASYIVMYILILPHQNKHKTTKYYKYNFIYIVYKVSFAIYSPYKYKLIFFVTDTDNERQHWAHCFAPSFRCMRSIILTQIRAQCNAQLNSSIQHPLKAPLRYYNKYATLTLVSQEKSV